MVSHLRSSGVGRACSRTRLRRTPQAVIAGAVLGAVFGPPVAAWVASKLPADFHPYIGNVVSMAVCTLVIIPALALLPGFPALGSTG